MWTRQQLARRIDHTLLKPEAGESQVRLLVAEALRYNFASVCINPRWVKVAAGLLAAAGAGRETADAEKRTAVCACVGFPFGAVSTASKAFEAKECLGDGAEEIDMVIFLPALLAGDLKTARADVCGVVEAVRTITKNIVVKVILETALLTAEQIALGCRAANEAGADFVKTSTGFHPAGGASVEAVRLLKAHAPTMRVKAAGGIRDSATARAMLEAGADRLGCSASVAIVDSWGGA